MTKELNLEYILKLLDNVTKMVTQVVPDQSPSQDQLTTIQEQDTTERILEYRDDAEVPPCTTQTKTECITIREAATY